MNSNMKIEVAEIGCKNCQRTFFELYEWPIEDECPHCKTVITDSSVEIIDTKEVEIQVDFNNGDIKVSQ